MGIGRQSASASTLRAFLKWAHAYGFRVAEHPDYGGVHPVHTKGSWHYDGLAADLNYGPAGSPASERTAAQYAIQVAQSMGLGVIYALRGTHGSAAGHRDHLHVDVSASTNLGDRYTTTPKGDRRVQQLQEAVGFPWKQRDNLWGPDTEKRLEDVRAASRFRGSKFPHGVAATQRAVGADDDGKWGPKSRAAHDRTVQAIQRVLGVKADGVWGPTTERAYQALRKEKR
ncbi:MULTISPECIES: peptidoglycan-binding domain-containing protein [unclassified Isoptericola]|uniref:peptidoglycan-binding domain-containing protein n=1 Tax=unclassified Isoptericola TaxID=2623355 RepID=UPI00364CD8F5